MAQYTTYEYYIDTYKGNIPKNEFEQLSRTASAKIKSLTFGRIDEQNIPDEVKYCICVIVDKLMNQFQNAGKSSESVGQWSVTYMTSNDGTSEIKSIVSDYLSECYDSNGTPLLYRGCITC